MVAPRPTANINLDTVVIGKLYPIYAWRRPSGGDNADGKLNTEILDQLDEQLGVN